MPNLRALLSGLVRHGSHRMEGAGHGVPAPSSAPEVLSGPELGPGGTARTIVEHEQVVDGQVHASIVHDVLVSAGVNLESNAMAVTVGAPRLLSSTLTPSNDGKSMVREEEIEVRVVLRTREQLNLFVEALSGASVEGTTLTLTPREAAAPTVTTVVEPPAAGATQIPGSGA